MVPTIHEKADPLWSRALAAGVVLLLLGLSMAAAEQIGAPLRSPFARTEAIRLDLPNRPRPVKCESPPEPVDDLHPVSKYGESRREHASSIIDTDAAAEYQLATRPVVEFTSAIAQFADRFAAKPAAELDDAECALRWMDEWALAGALLGEMNETGHSVRKWQLATLASAFLKIRKAPLNKQQSRRVSDWLRLVAMEVRDHYSRRLELDSRSNNHLNWAAWAVSAAAIASDDRSLFSWSVDRYQYALAQIGEDGTLPLELKRRQLALAYHNFALGPLILLREGASANGIELTADNERRLQRLVDVVLAGLADPSRIAARAGYPQDLSQIKPVQLAWLEPYYARTRDPRALPWLQRLRPMGFSRLGGNLTMLYGPVSTPMQHPR